LTTLTRASSEAVVLALSWAYADVAQSVEHQLPKLRVAGSIPVVRSSKAQVIGTFLTSSGRFVCSPIFAARLKEMDAARRSDVFVQERTNATQQRGIGLLSYRQAAHADLLRNMCNHVGVPVPELLDPLTDTTS
jgi:hypothetical protein